MKMPLEITFGTSTSPRFAAAVRLAASLPGYHCQGGGREVSHQVKLEVSLADDKSWHVIERLLHMVGSWRSTALEVAGQPQQRWRLAYDVAAIRTCYARKVSEGTGDHYCSGKRAPGDDGTAFGCRLCRSVTCSPDELYFSERERPWTTFGTLSPDASSFQVDKKIILQVLQKEAVDNQCIYCPAFSDKRLRGDVAELPDVIDPKKDSRFELCSASGGAGKPVGIRFKSTDLDEAEVPQPPPPPQRREVPQVRFADIAGQDAALEQVRRAVQLPLTHPKHFAALGVEPQAGVILFGPPGNGKSLIAKALANECQAHLEIINGPEVLSKWVGESEANLRHIFRRARQEAPSVLLIDELDCLAPRRATVGHHHDVQIISQLLVLLDGLEERGRVAVVATTNRIEALDPALCRPGRFDYHIEVPPPNRQGREAILRVYLKKLKTKGVLPITDLAAQTEGFSGAELAALCREAGLQTVLRGIAAHRRPGNLTVSAADVYTALQGLRQKRICKLVSMVDAED